MPSLVLVSEIDVSIFVGHTVLVKLNKKNAAKDEHPEIANFWGVPTCQGKVTCFALSSGVSFATD
jgi:hypothetical protein